MKEEFQTIKFILYIMLPFISFKSNLYRAFYPEIFERSGAVQMVDQFGDWFTHKNTSRSKIFERQQGEVWL